MDAARSTGARTGSLLIKSKIGLNKPRPIMPHQAALFSDNAPDSNAASAPPAPPDGHGTAVTALKFTAGKLSPEQQRFNRMLAQTEELARKIEAAQLLADSHRPRVASTLRPLEQERDRLIRQMALWLDQRLQRKGLTAKHKRWASEIICYLSESLTINGDEAMQTLHDAHSEQTLAEKERAAASDMQDFMEEILGKPFGGEQDFDNLEDLLRAGTAQMQQESQAAQQARASKKSKRKQSASQQKTEQQAQDANAALRSIYRQLVSALHPDRESDASERIRKTALLKEVNAAYKRRDLLALLQLQLSANLANSDKVSHLAREKLASLTLLLRERVALLTRELLAIERRTISEFGLHPYRPLSAAALKRSLLDEQQELQADIALMQRDFQRVQDDTQFKRWLREQHEAQLDDFDEFDSIPF